MTFFAWLEEKKWGVWIVERQAWCCVQAGNHESDTPWRGTHTRCMALQQRMARMYPFTYIVRLYNLNWERD